MRTIAFALAMFMATGALGVSDARAQWIHPPPFPPEVTMFYGDLAPYGQWVYLLEYGWCWQPSPSAVGVGWVPYTRGHWELTEVGWTWVSDFLWGWGPFHYGGWVDDALYGWVWVPDVYWAPAWVEWRIGGGYIGWCPLPPRRITIARPVHVARPPRGWTFVGDAGFVAPAVKAIPTATAEAIWPHTKVLPDATSVGRRAVWVGPPVAKVEARIGRPVHRTAITDVHAHSPMWSPRAAPPPPVQRAKPVPPARPPVPVRPAPPRIKPTPARPTPRPKVSQRERKAS